MTAREELIGIQRRMVLELKREIYDSLYGRSDQLRKYARSYDKHFETQGRIVSRETLLRSVTKSDVVFHGDFHTLKMAQLSPIKIIRELQDRGRRVVLGLEMFCARNQRVLDQFQAMQLSEKSFLKKIRYDRTWGFDWDHYRNLVYFAIGRGIPIVGLDCRKASGYVSLQARDEFAARKIAERRAKHKDELVYVFFGELHVAPDHLPAALDDATEGRKPKRTILYQNNETLYWNLAAREREHDAGILRLAPDQYCLMNSTPLVVYQSYRNWSEKQEELSLHLQHWWEGTGNLIDFTEQVHQLVRVIAEFLDLPSGDLEDFTVYSSQDLDFLHHLRKRHRLPDERIEWLKSEIRSAKSLFIPEGNIIYLASISTNRAAQEAARFVHSRAARYSGPAENPRDHFYSTVMNQALGFFGSKIVNHKRTAKRKSYYEKVVNSAEGRKLSPKEARFVKIARLFLEHRDREPTDFVSELEPHLHRGVTGAVGHLLGDDLYVGLIKGWIDKEEICDLFRTRFEEPNRGFETYSRLCEHLRRKRRTRQRARSSHTGGARGS